MLLHYIAFRDLLTYSSYGTKIYSNSRIALALYYAGGWGGQRIMVFPELNAVVIFTGGNYTSTVRTFAILENYVIPAIDSGNE